MQSLSFTAADGARCTYKLSGARDVGALQEKMRKFNGKSKPAKIKPDSRAYPIFKAGMSTADYVRMYENANGAKFVAGFYDRASLNSDPCELYTGEDLHETIADDAPIIDAAPIAQDAAPAPCYAIPAASGAAPATHSQTPGAERVRAFLSAGAMDDRPCAAAGLTSYRARGRYGWIMIGAKDAADAMREALRSTDTPGELQVWDGARYVPAPVPGDSQAALTSAQALHTAAHFEARGIAEANPLHFRMAARFAARARPSVPIHAAHYRPAGPALRLADTDPRLRIPARFAPTYAFQGAAQ
jgi:hypothetical protein